MKRLLPALSAALVLSACGANLSGNLLDSPSDVPAGFTGIRVMKVCQVAKGSCAQREVDSDGTKVLGIRDASGAWIGVRDSGCTNGYCWATGADGAEWRMQP